MSVHKKIGERLVDAGLLDESKVTQILERQASSQEKFGKIAVDMGFVEEGALLNHLAEQLHVPYVELKYFDIKADVVQVLPENLAKRFKAIPLDKIGDSYLVAMSDPSDLIAFDEVARKLKSSVRPALVKESELMKLIDQVYRRTDEIKSFATELADEFKTNAVMEEELTQDSGAPVSKMIETIFEDAVQVGASDVHIEPDKDSLRIRMRVDGMLQEQMMDQKNIAAAIVLRIKLMSQLNISERRLPQDGRFSLNIAGKAIDVRVSTMPVQYGESVVMRILDQTGGVLSLKDIDMPEHIKTVIEHHISRPHGMILVTGPTGSGKSTTLYGCLAALNQPEKKIITVEDPVEYQLSRVNQVQVQHKIGLTFARVLRACLRQDPDIVMVGEIRDEETASIALKAALTGHLVFSTLHTNDAASAPIRLIDMGVEPFLVGTALRLVIAQRLVRKICDQCIDEEVPDERAMMLLETLLGKKAIKGVAFKKGRGCAQCQRTGYRGRIGAYEVIEVDQKLSGLLRSGETEAFMSAVKKQKSYQSLGEAVFEYVKQGRSTIEEVFRLAGDIDGDAGDDLLHEAEQHMEEQA